VEVFVPLGRKKVLALDNAAVPDPNLAVMLSLSGDEATRPASPVVTRASKGKGK